MLLLICVAFLALGAAVAGLTGAFSFKGWLYQLLIVIDQAANVLLTPFHGGAWADETLSARAYRAHRDGRAWGRVAMPVIDALFRWQSPTHCQDAYDKERRRIHQPPEVR